jgi:hypothetical protein
LSGKQQVGVTQPRGLYVDENFTSHRRANVHILKIEPSTDCIKHKCLHSCLLSSFEPSPANCAYRLPHEGPTWPILSNSALARVRDPNFAIEQPFLPQ